MASIRKKGKRWEAAISRQGIRKSSTFATKLEAQFWAAEIEKTITSGKYGDHQDRTVENMLQRYLSIVSVKKRGADKEKIRIMRLCRDDIAQIKLGELQPWHLAEWRDRRLKEVSDATVQRDWNLLSHAFNVSVNEWQWITENPLKKVTRPKTPPPRDRRFTDDEIERLLLALGYDHNTKPETVTARIGAAMLFAIETAMRAGEIVSLTWESVDLVKRVAHLPKTKNGFPRYVPLSPEAIRIMDQVKIDGSESVFNIRSDQVGALFRKAKSRAMIDDLHFHDTRAEAITRLAKKLDILSLARMTGHRDLKKLQIYYRESAEDIAKRL